MHLQGGSTPHHSRLHPFTLGKRKVTPQSLQLQLQPQKVSRPEESEQVACGQSWLDGGGGGVTQGHTDHALLCTGVGGAGALLGRGCPAHREGGRGANCSLW